MVSNTTSRGARDQRALAHPVCEAHDAHDVDVLVVQQTAGLQVTGAGKDRLVVRLSQHPDTQTGDN